MNKLSDVDVSLSQGQLYSSKHIIVLRLALISASLLIIAGIMSLVLSCIEWDKEIFVSAILCTLMGIGFLSVLIYCFAKDKKIKKQVVTWLSDAVKTTAISSKVGEYRAGLQPSSVKIRVEFSLNGLTYSRESTAACFGGKPGYLGAFKPYTDRKIKILYSPKYDEILILKATENERNSVIKPKCVPTREEIVESMHDKGLNYIDKYKIINVLYSSDNEHRFVILKADDNYLTYSFESLRFYDNDELSYCSDGEFAYWLPENYGSKPVFNDLGILMRELTATPEYKTFFVARSNP